MFCEKNVKTYLPRLLESLTVESWGRTSYTSASSRVWWYPFQKMRPVHLTKTRDKQSADDNILQSTYNQSAKEGVYISFSR